MLNIYPSSIPSVPHLPPDPRRRRGGQPLNHNALNHGLYAVKNRTPLTEISSSIPAYPRFLDTSSSTVAQQLILDLTGEIGWAYQKLRSVEDNRSMIAWFNTTVRMASLVGRVKVDFVKRFVIGSDLQVVSEHALALIHNSFWEKGIVGEAHSFRTNIDKSDFNFLALQEALCHSVSRAPFPFLTPRQWAVLAPLLPPAERTGKRGRPPADPRILLDAIFWKLAHHARWQDLPPWYPPMLTCRRYYRRLFLSGRLDMLYSALYQDLLARSKVSLHGLVEQKSVAISENKVILHSGLDKQWQTRTALLILQQVYQALRRERREKAHGNRPQIHTARMIARDKEIQARASREEEEFTYTPIDLANLGTDQENAGALAMPIGKKRLKPSRHIDKGNYKFTPIDLGNLGSDEGDDEPPPKPRRKTTSLSPSQMKGYDKLFLP
jgi:Transposase and inactivated derivatives